MSHAFFSLMWTLQKSLGRVFSPSLGFECGNFMIRCDNEQCEIVGALIASRSIEISCIFWMWLDGLLWNVSPWRFYLQSIVSSNKLSKLRRQVFFLILQGSFLLRLLKLLALEIRSQVKLSHFFLESDTAQFTKSFAKIWWTFLWTSENFMLGLKPEAKHISLGVRFHFDQLTRLSPQVVLIISCLKMREKD